MATAPSKYVLCNHDAFARNTICQCSQPMSSSRTLPLLFLSLGVWQRGKPSNQPRNLKSSGETQKNGPLTGMRQ